MTFPWTEVRGQELIEVIDQQAKELRFYPGASVHDLVDKVKTGLEYLTLSTMTLPKLKLQCNLNNDYRAKTNLAFQAEFLEVIGLNQPS